ncbi:MAG TPA: regulatory protein RecX [Chromatiaceae bacterium]|nr:regulatory protein RecX [Chromatiaceae bacterium]
MHLLSLREHSRFELERKLLRRHEQAMVQQVLQNLAQQGLQSDERFAEQYVYSRRNKGYGPLRIRAELREKGVAEDLISIWLDDPEQDWYALMLATAEKKFGGQPPADRKEMAKRGRFLSSRGFPSWMINDYLFG